MGKKRKNIKKKVRIVISTSQKINSNNSPKKESSFFKWLKPVLQTVTIIISIVGLFFAFKTYSNTKSVQIHLEYYNGEDFFNFENKTCFLMLVKADDNFMSFDQFIIDDYQRTVLPAIVNKSKKGIKNFNLKVHAFFDIYNLKLDDIDVNNNFEITKVDIRNHVNIDFEYKYDVLHAKTSVSSPLDYLYLPNDSTYHDSHVMSFEYNLTYEGISKPITYEVIMYVDFTDSQKLSDESIDSFLDLCLANASLYKGNSTVVVVYDGFNPIDIVRQVDLGAFDRAGAFEEYKTEIIMNHNNGEELE